MAVLVVVGNIKYIKMQANIKTFVFTLLLIISLFNKCICQNTNTITSIDSESIYVFDSESILTASEKLKLSQDILLFKQKEQKEIFIITTDSIGHFKDLQEYATYLRWSYTEAKNSDDVLIIAVSKNLRSVGISTGSSIKEKLTDKICENIIHKDMIPEFKKGNFFEGIEHAIDKIQLIFN